MPSNDNKQCCDQACVKTETCEGVECPDFQKCVRGQCYEETCNERTWPLCAENEICTDEYYIDDLVIKCCSGECRRPCVNDTGCYPGESCKTGYCIVEACEDIGGLTCDAKTEKCIGEIERTLDNDNCCLECGLKTCEEREGIECNANIGEACTTTTDETLDVAECCFDECVVDWCFDKPCAINQKCDSEKEKCVFKTCEEMEGDI